MATPFVPYIPPPPSKSSSTVASTPTSSREGADSPATWNRPLNTPPVNLDDEDMNGNESMTVDINVQSQCVSTSTPLARHAGTRGSDGDTSSVADSEHELTASATQTDVDLTELEVPILGYEIIEERERFTVFRLCVQKSPGISWFLFRRYSDFVRLNEKLQELFPQFRLALPPKKWFGDNFEKKFLEERSAGLQAFINNVIGHRDACNSEPVRAFLCLDAPPGPHDSLEESRALCDALEEELYFLRQELQARDAKISLLQDEVDIYREEVAQLRNALRVEQAVNRRASVSPPSESSLTEQEQNEADPSADLSIQDKHPQSAELPIMNGFTSEAAHEIKAEQSHTDSEVAHEIKAEQSHTDSEVAEPGL